MIKQADEDISVIDIKRLPIPLAFLLLVMGKRFFVEMFSGIIRKNIVSGRCGKLIGMRMQENNHSFESYVNAISAQVEQHISGLIELSEISVRKLLTFNERSAVKRNMQVMVETA